MQISPRGDRIAWDLSLEGVPPFQALLHRLFHRFHAAPIRTIALYTSRIDGSDLHLVGRMSSRIGPDDLYRPEHLKYPFELKWLPDGKRLSFVYKNALYTIPAD